MYRLVVAVIALLCISKMASNTSAFMPPTTIKFNNKIAEKASITDTSLFIFGNNNKKKQATDEEIFGGKSRISDKRRQQLGIGDNEEEYDLGVALQANTDDTISKIIAGSFIIAISALLVAGIVIPATTDYGDGICNALASGGRC